MIHQYGAQRSRWSIPPVAITMPAEPKRGRKLALPERIEYRTAQGARLIGTIDIGEVIYIQDNVRPFSPIRHPVMREPWIVQAWMNRHHKPTGQYLRGGHLAQVKSLRTGRVAFIADWILLRCSDL